MLKEAEAKFTPGPWFARMQSGPRGDLGWIIEHDNGRIGWSSFATASPNEGEGAPYSIGGANARLIAASPDLVNALRRLCKSFPTDTDMLQAGWEPLEIEEACKAYDAARAALSKAGA